MVTELVRDVTDLPAGTRIPTHDDKIGTLTVLGTFDDYEDGRLVAVEVDVTCDRNADIWDMQVLAEAVGATDAMWLANTPRRRYRLFYGPKAEVATIDEEGTDR